MAYTVHNYVSNTHLYATQLNEMDAGIKHAYDTADALQTTVTALNTNVGTMQTAVTALNNNVGTMQTSVNTMQSDVGGLKSDNTTLKAQDKATRNALTAFLNQLVQLIPDMAFSNASHNGADVVSAANAAIVAMGGESEGGDDEPTYTANVLYSNYTPAGQRFSTDNVSINFAAGDYFEAQIDASTCTQDQENILAIGKNSTSYIESYNSAVAFLFYKRAQSGVDKILLRIKDSDSNVTVDKWVEPADMQSVMIRIDKDGVSIDGNRISGITSADIENLIGLGTYIVGARASKLTTATYDHITVYSLT